MDSLLRLPALHKVASWANVERGNAAQFDIAENWRLLWAKWLTAYTGSPAGKTSEELEIEVIGEILDEFTATRPTPISLHDYRVAFYQRICLASSVTCQGLQLTDLIYAIMGPDVYEPLKFTDGASKLFHCGFNGFTLDEVSQTTITDARKIDIKNDSVNSFMGLRSPSADTFTWPVTLPTLADFSKLTIRWIFSSLADASLKAGPLNGNPATTNGAFILQINATDKIGFGINDGTSFVSIASDAVITNNTLYEVWAVVDGTDIKMYVNGVLQADTNTLAAAAAFYTAAGVLLGSAGVEFVGTNYELAIDGEVLTP